MSKGRFGSVMEQYVCDKCGETVQAFAQLYVFGKKAHCVPCAIQDPTLAKQWERTAPATERAKYLRGVEVA